MSAGFATRPLPLGKFGSETGSNGSERASPKLRSPRLSPEKRFVVGLNTHPNEFPKNYYGTRVTSPRRVDDDRLLSTRMSSTQASARPRRDPPVSPRNLPKLQATMTTQGMDAAKPWGGSKPLPLITRGISKQRTTSLGPAYKIWIRGMLRSTETGLPRSLILCPETWKRQSPRTTLRLRLN